MKHLLTRLGLTALGRVNTKQEFERFDDQGEVEEAEKDYIEFIEA